MPVTKISSAIPRSCKPLSIECASLRKKMSARQGRQNFLTTKPDRLLHRRSQHLVPVFLTIPEKHRRSLFSLALFLHVNPQYGFLLHRHLFHGEGFEWQVNQQELGFRSLGAPRILLGAMNDEPAGPAPL